MLRTRKNALFPTSVCCWLIVLESCRITPPRMREKLIDALTIISKVRITPRMRGKHTGRKSADAALRITPAHAGKTIHCICAELLTPDHPRTCGENTLWRSIWLETCGSPPHMRGKRDKFKQYVGSLRITPAHAGKTSQVHRWHSRRPDHPRTCGENIKKEDLMRQVDGSPPHMRGKLAEPHWPFWSAYITPAHAGKTLRSSFPDRMSTDHPRTCGENFLMVISPIWLIGSPPHMRGKQPISCLAHAWHRITPAHAGKTELLKSQPIADADHPRTCGENTVRGKSLYFPCGSPPHMRGKPTISQMESGKQRITPAHAGKTQCVPCQIMSTPDHPRTCGENAGFRR